jgi:hypothetical protein
MQNIFNILIDWTKFMKTLIKKIKKILNQDYNYHGNNMFGKEI